MQARCRIASQGKHTAVEACCSYSQHLGITVGLKGAILGQRRALSSAHLLTTKTLRTDVSYSLNSLKGDIHGMTWGTITGVIKWDSWTLDPKP